MMDSKRRFAAESNIKPRPLFSMGLLEDANAVQVALMQVLQLLGCGQMDPKTAGLMLYGLQTASCNLRHTTFEAGKATDVVIDRNSVDQTCIIGPQWFARDFADTVEEVEVEEGEVKEAEEVEEAEEDGVAAAGDGQVPGEIAANADDGDPCRVGKRKKPERISPEDPPMWAQSIMKKIVPEWKVSDHPMIPRER
jgi:hypothetical protein